MLDVKCTLNAFITGFQVCFELLETRPRALELCVRDAYLAHSLAGAASISGQQNVPEAAHVSHVLLNATPDFQSSVQRFSHDDDFSLRTLGSEHLRIAVVTTVHT